MIHEKLKLLDVRLQSIITVTMIRLLVLLTCCSMTSCEGVVSTKYVAMTSSVKSPVCATDKPTTAISMAAGSKLRCAGECTRQPCCLVHQLNDDMKQCQLYDFIPTNYSLGTQQCTAFNINQPSANGTAKSCSFPFTYDGQLYYTCAVNKSATPCHMWCPLSYNVRAICTGATYGYAAQNTTVNVTIPTITIPVSLRSVNGWLTILSRIDSNFPVGQSNAAYQNGFGTITSNVWLGLEPIHQLTDSTVNGGHQYRLRFEMLSITDNKWFSEEYDSFHIGGSSNYNLYVSNVGVGDAGDMLNGGYGSNGQAFVTNSAYCVNACGPWWYTNPSMYCCYGHMFGNAGTCGFSWNNVGQLQVSRMMMSQVN